MTPLKIGYAMCGSFCTVARSLEVLAELAQAGHDITAILSENLMKFDTRFGKAEDIRRKAEALCGKKAITTIAEAEPIGPKKLFDIVVVAPCTGNTLAKLAQGITDTCVTMACKSHLRNGGAVLLAPATNDGLLASAPNIGRLLSRKNVYFVPLGQDDPSGKPASLVALFERIPQAVEAAMEGRQLQPVLAG